jgi:Xaa-Pro aminopeptidase
MCNRSSFLICLLASTSFIANAQEGFSPFATNFPPEEFSDRRAAVYDAMGSSTLALIQGTPAPAGYTRFRQSNEFYYLSGVETPHSCMLLDGAQRRAALYLPQRNQGRERAEGKVLSAEDETLIRQLAGVDAVYGVDILPEHLARYSRSTSQCTLFTPFSPAEGAAMSRDLAVRSIGDAAVDPFDRCLSPEGSLNQSMRLLFPQFEVRDLSPILDNLRLMKNPREIAVIRKATQLAGLALMECM